MLIDWFTVWAQILNFLILVALLRWFLYRPLLRVMEKRQNLITEQWQEAEQRQAEAQQALATYQQQQEELHQQRAHWLAEAKIAVDQERQRLLQQLRQEIQTQRQAWQTELSQEQSSFLRTLRQNVIHQASAIARQALRDLANADLEAQLVNVLCDRLQQLETSQRQAITEALAPPAQTILIRSHFEWPPALRQQLTAALQAQFPLHPPLEFLTTSELSCGIVIKLAGQEIGWSFDRYLQTLDQRLSEALTQAETASHDSPLSAGTGDLH